MDAQLIFTALRKNPAMQLATVDPDGNPRVRGMLLYSADETGIVFHTGDFKAVYRELKSNPCVELCFMDSGSQTQIRVSGTCLEVDDEALRDEIIASPGREFLKPMIERWGRSSIRVFRLAGGRAQCWNFMTNGVYPKELVAL